MLDKIRFHGFDITGSSLTINDDDSEGGRYKISFSEHKVTPQSDEDGNWIFIEVTPKIVGYSNDNIDSESNEDDSNEAFVAQASLILSFQCNFEEEVSEDSYNENRWFFDNYIYACTKISFEKLFANSVLDTIKLPWSQNFRDTVLEPEK